MLKNGTLVTLLSWVEGRPIKSEEGGKYAEELAQLACRIHNATKGFEGERIDYDNALCNRMVSEIRHAVELGHLSEECAEKCIAEIHAVEQVQHKQTERYGKTLIHADIFLSFFVLLFICTQHEHVYQEEWFKGALAMWCENLFIH